MKYTNDPEKREPAPVIDSVVLIEHNEKQYLGWMNIEEIEEGNTSQTCLFDALQVELHPGEDSWYAENETKDTEILGRIHITAPYADVPVQRLFQAYDSLQVFGMETALAKVYLDARKYLLTRPVTLKPVVHYRKVQPNGTR